MTDTFTALGAVPVDSGRILLVDPTHLPDDLLAALTSPNEHGVTLGVVYNTRHGDGLFYADVTEDGLHVFDPSDDLLDALDAEVCDDCRSCCPSEQP